MKKTIGVLRRIFGEVFWIAVTGAVIVGGIQGFQLLKSNRAVVEIAPAERPVPVVATLEAAPWDAPLPVRAQGFVQPLRTVSLASPAGGTIAELHPAIVNERGTFEQGEVLVRFDDRAERANLRQSEANITAARTQLELETTRLERTRALFERGSASQQALDEALGRFDEAAARLDGLIAGQAAIEVALANKEIRAPFAGAILSKSAEVGSVIGAGQAIAEAYTDKRLTVDVKLSEAAAGLIPGLFEGAAPRAEVQLDFAGQTYSGAAKVASVAPGIDPRTRTIGLTFELENGGRLSPTGGATLASGMPPALVNSYVRLVIEGAAPASTYRLPSTAFHNGKVWLLDAGRLSIIPARALHVDGADTFVELEPLPEGAQFVVSTIPAPVEGMPLQSFEAADTEITAAALADEE